MAKNDSTGGALRKMLEGTNSFKSYSDLETAKSDPNAYVVMEGDWGGQIYLTCPVRYVICDEDMLKKILKKLDHMCWKCNGGDGAAIRYETFSQGEIVAGGMEGGLAADGLWIHPKILEMNDIKEELEVLILGANTPWIYTNVTRQEFEAVKDKVERIFVELGCIKVDIDLPYVQKTTSILGDGEKVVDYSYRPTFHKGHWYYRVDEVCFPDKPFITIEFGDYNDLINNIMEDLDPFPFDLTDSELLDEVKRKIIEE